MPQQIILGRSSKDNQFFREWKQLSGAQFDTLPFVNKVFRSVHAIVTVVTMIFVKSA